METLICIIHMPASDQGEQQQDSSLQGTVIKQRWVQGAQGRAVGSSEGHSQKAAWDGPRQGQEGPLVYCSQESCPFQLPRHAGQASTSVSTYLQPVSKNDGVGKEEERWGRDAMYPA